MSKIILDCGLMKTPASGLYYYCLNLGLYINELLESSGQPALNFYVPSKQEQAFGNTKNTIVERSIHRYVKPFLWDCKVWHAPFQSGRIIPYHNKKIKVVLTVHDLNPLHQDLPREEQKKSIAHTQKLINRSSAVVCISEFVKEDVLRNCEVKNKPVYVIHNGINALQKPELAVTSCRPLRPFLFAMGFVNRKKNFHVLLPLLQHNPDIELVIAGRLDEPDYIDYLKKYAQGKGVSDRLHIIGPVNEQEKAWYLNHCAAFMQPSLAEGFGLPVVEAMSLGKPLFLSTRTSLPEIGGDAAFYFDSFKPDHMRQVYAAGMMEYSKNGLASKIIERSKQFNWKDKAEEYIKVYESLL